MPMPDRWRDPDGPAPPDPAGPAPPEHTARADASSRPDGSRDREATVTSDSGGRQRRWSSQELLGSQGEAEISHAGAIYRLRLTALGKLILTK